MGVYIPNMSKPKSCNKCPFTCEALQFFNGKDRPQTCPLIEIDDEAIDIAQDIIDGCKRFKERRNNENGIMDNSNMRID